MVWSFVGLVLALILGGFNQSSPLEMLGKLDPHELPEASGIVKSRRHDGIFWIHNDSGNPPALFAIRRDGKIVRRYKLDIPNVDWEDIAIDDAGRLYLGDIGNNGGLLPIRAIYQIAEPDPSRPPDGPVKATRAWFYTFPRGRRHDAESLWVEGKSAFLVAKTFDGRDAEIFELPLDQSSTIFKPMTPTFRGTLGRFPEPATGADLSADGGWLAVCSSNFARVYRRAERESKQPVTNPNGGDLPAWEPFAVVAYPACAIEAICWDGLDLILAGEDQRLSRLAESVWSEGSIAKKKPKARERASIDIGNSDAVSPETIP